MKYFNEELQKLQEQSARKNHLESTLKGLRDQQRDLQDKLRELKQLCSSENADVENLEGFSLAGLYYLIIGKKEERLDKERQEAYTAQLKCDAAQMELDSVTEAIQKTLALIAELHGCEEQFAKIKSEKKEIIKRSGTPEAMKILELEEQIAYCENQIKEIREASSVGSEALRIADEIIHSLDKAKGWGTWDTFAGGGLISDMAKHSHLNTAQRLVGDLQLKLRRYKTELMDIQISADVEVGIGGFLNFADYFFDSILVDWTVLNKITKSKSQAEATRNKISLLQYKLNDMKAAKERERDQKREEIDQIVLQNH